MVKQAVARLLHHRNPGRGTATVFPTEFIPMKIGSGIESRDDGDRHSDINIITVIPTGTEESNVGMPPVTARTQQPVRVRQTSPASHVALLTRLKYALNPPRNAITDIPNYPAVNLP
ncbi:MAG: hypothetical protein IIA53_09980 [Chloroflexi bacterium]|nr:hypothetical protein [Chloroflexota bacterium]